MHSDGLDGFADSLGVQYVRADELGAGDEVVERDGALLKIASVATEARGTLVLITFDRGMWSRVPGPVRVRRTTKIRIAKRA